MRDGMAESMEERRKRQGEPSGPGDRRPVVLFVDQEDWTLDGLARAMGSKISSWRLRSARDAEEAVRILEEEKTFAARRTDAEEGAAAAARCWTGVDAVVSDLRALGLDGALLERVRDRYPGTARFVLSGFAEGDAFLRAIGPAHRHFTKPCDPKILARAIERTLAVRARLKSNGTMALVTGARGVPAFPKSLSELVAHIQSPDASAASVSRIVSGDVGLTTQMLKFANSSYFHLPAKVSDSFQAVKLLGIDFVRSLALLAGAFEAFRGVGIDYAAISASGDRSLLLAAAAAKMAAAEGLPPAERDVCRCAGVLSHVGTLLLASRRPDEMKAIAAEKASGGLAGDKAALLERGLLGADHASVGGALLDLWGFDEELVDAVARHHGLEEDEDPKNHLRADGSPGPALLLHAAHVFSCGGGEADVCPRWVEAAGCGERLGTWRREFSAIQADGTKPEAP